VTAQLIVTEQIKSRSELLPDGDQHSCRYPEPSVEDTGIRWPLEGRRDAWGGAGTRHGNEIRSRSLLPHHGGRTPEQSEGLRLPATHSEARVSPFVP